MEVTEQGALFAAVRGVFDLIASGKAAGSALEARRRGFLRGGDGISMNKRRLIGRRQGVVAPAAAGYEPSSPRQVFVTGERGYEQLLELARERQMAGTWTGYDVEMAGAPARILSGGGKGAAGWVPAARLFDLEREVFIERCAKTKTQDRIRHVLATGKSVEELRENSKSEGQDSKTLDLEHPQAAERLVKTGRRRAVAGGIRPTGGWGATYQGTPEATGANSSSPSNQQANRKGPAMKSLKNLTGDSLEQLIDYNVVDQNGDEIGTLHSLWSDPDTGAVEFLGVKTGWLFGHNHVVPASKAELDESANVVRLPYTEAFIKDAPAISADAEISEAEEDNIYRYYGIEDGETGVSASGPSVSTGARGAYAGVGGSGIPEAAGADGLASASEPSDGPSGYAVPVSGSVGEEGAGTSRWRRTSRPNDNVSSDTSAPASTGTMTPKAELLADAASSAQDTSSGTAVRSALDDLSPSDSSGTREPLAAASPGSYGTANLYGSTGMNSPVSSDALGEPIDIGTTVTGGSSTTNPDATSHAATPVGRHANTGEAGADLRETGGANHGTRTGEPG